MLDSNLVLPRLLANLARDSGEQIWLQHVDGSSMTFSEAEEKIVAWATGLRDLGVATGDTVLVMVPNSFDAALIWPAAARLNTIEVAVNNAYRGSILTHVANDSGARVAIVDASFVDRFEAIRDDLATLETIIVIGASDELPDWGRQLVRAEDALAVSDP